MPAPEERLRLAEQLCDRISHDLSGVIGTLCGALDMTDDPAVAGEAALVARQAATELRHRLELQRACWGSAPAALDLPALRLLAEGLPQGRRCALDLAGLPEATVFSPGFGRVVLNLLLLASESLRFGGVIALSGSGSDLVVAIAGPHAAWPDGLVRCLASADAAWDALRDPRSLLLPLTALLARSQGLRLSLLLPAGAPGPAPPLRLTQA